jgi:hypothetical protein
MKRMKSGLKEIRKYNIDPNKFWDRVPMGDPNECWDWPGARNQKGYGLFAVRTLPDDYERTGRTWTQLVASRVAYYLTHGDKFDGFYICHKCDNPSCVRPEHLFLGTAKENNKDMFDKGRNPNQVGSSNGFAKLTEESVKEMRAIYAAGGISFSKLARMFSVTEMAAHNAVRKKTWKHV